MLQEPRQSHHSEKGFTLIEIMVVILIISILTVIGLPAFLNQRNKARDAEAKMAARTAQTAVETYYNDHQSYAGVDVTKLRVIEPALNEGVAAAGLVITPTPSSYEIVVTQAKTGSVFTIANPPTGAVSRTCTPAGSNGCPSGGKW